MDSQALAHRHLETRLGPYRRSLDLERPPRGWIRAMREALGMTAAQLARRLRVSQPRISQLEKDEKNENVTLKTLREAAEALDCRLVYALIPNRPLEDILRDRAAHVADRHLTHVNHTMALENQSLDRAGRNAERKRVIDELLRGNPKHLWDEP
jgi:predicted DNA-binding mobile mystery protein A